MLKTRITEHKAATHNRYLTVLHRIDNGHQFTRDEAQIVEAIHSDTNSISRPITLGYCYAIINERLICELYLCTI